MWTNLGAGLSDGAEVVDHVGLGHTHTGISDSEELVLLVRNDTDVELLLRLEGRRIGERSITNFIEGV